MTNENDLISRSELKKALKSNCDTLCNDKNTNWCEHCCPLNDFEDLIDNAPTVELTEEQAIDKLHETGWLQEHDKQMTKRPQGEWIEGENGSIKCNQCGCEIIYSYFIGNKPDFPKFCCDCGADMRGDNNDKSSNRYT